MQENTKIIDARGAFCPGPLMELMKASKDAHGGEVLELWTNESGSLKDVPEWANKMGHKFLGSEEVQKADGNYHRLLVEMKGS